MTGRQIVCVWVASFALVLTVIFPLLPLDETAPDHPSQAMRKLLAAAPPWDTVVIGSSLTQAAIPTVTDPGFFSDKAAVRISRPVLSQNELMTIAEFAVKANAAHILIEAERLTRTTLADQSVIRNRIEAVAKPVRRNFQAILKGEYPRTWTIHGESSYLDGTIPPSGLALRESYFLKPTALLNPERWEAFLKSAEANGTSVSLLVYPRSQSASDFLADPDEFAVRQAILDFAQRYGLAVFYPAVAWPNRFFADRAHLNRIGRDRYLRELAAWLEAKP